MGRGTHPDQDLLADLAADVLPPGEAGRVSDHVAGCAECSGLLSEAESVTALLRGPEPGPMPDEVLARIESALRAEAGLSAGAGLPAQAGLPARAGLRATAEPGTDTTARPATSSGPAGTPLRLVGRRIERPRRQAREERRADARAAARPARLQLAAAAAVLLAAGGVAVGVADLLDGTDQEPGTSVAAGEDAALAPEVADNRYATEWAGPPVLSPVLATGTDYRTAALRTQVRQLVQRAAQSPAPRTADASQPLGNPVALRACLAALDLPDEQPVAVDLARWNGKEAAVLVLRNPENGYDVWAVARTCRPGADGALAFTTTPG